MQVRVLPGVPIHAALAQLQEALRSDRRGWGWKSLTRHHFAHVAQGRGSALKTRPVSVQIRPWAPAARVAQRRGTKLKPSKVRVQIPPRAPFWNVNRSSEPGLGANECVPLLRDVVRVHGIPPVFGGRAQAPACSSKRTVRLINGIALDECRVRERYPARRPFLHLRARRSSSDPHMQDMSR